MESSSSCRLMSSARRGADFKNVDNMGVVGEGHEYLSDFGVAILTRVNDTNTHTHKHTLTTKSTT